MQTLDELRRFFAASPFMADLGVEPLAVQPGRLRTRLPVQPPAGHWAVTAELKTSQLRPGRGERLVCEAWVVKPSRRLSFTAAEVWAETGGGERVPAMKASATMALLPHQE